MKYNESEPMSAVDDVYGTLDEIIAEVKLCQQEGCTVEHFEVVPLEPDDWRMTIWYNNEGYRGG